MKILTYCPFLFFSVILPVFAATHLYPPTSQGSEVANNEEPSPPTHRGVQELININFPDGIPVHPLPMPKVRATRNGTTNAILATQAAEVNGMPRSNVHQIITVVLATELLGGVHNSTEVDLLCRNFKWNRYSKLGLNETMINEMLCDKNLVNILPASVDEIKSIVQQWLSALWVQQTYGIMMGNYDKICDIISEDGASTVDIDGKQMKGVFCKRKKKDK